MKSQDQRAILCELLRLNFVLHRDGKEKAIQFAEEIIFRYNKALKYPKSDEASHHARMREYRRKFIVSIAICKLFLRMHRNAD